MPAIRLPPAFDLLAKERSPAADEAILEALPHLSDEQQELAFSLLASRQHLLTLCNVVRAWRDWPPTLQAIVLRQSPAMHSAIRACVASTETDDRLAAISWIESAEDVRSSYVLVEALHTDYPAARHAAGAALKSLTDRALPRASSDHALSDGSRLQAGVLVLRDAIAQALDAWDVHREQAVLEAFLVLSEHIDGWFEARLDGASTKLTQAMERAMEGATDPAMAGTVLRSLTVPGLRAMAAHSIANAQSSAFIAAVLERCWLLADPKIEAGCRWIRKLRQPDAWLQATTDSGHTLVDQGLRLIAAMGLAHDERNQMMRWFIESDRVESRRAALWRFVDDDSNVATETLGAAASRRDGPIAVIADRELRRRRRSTFHAASDRRSALEPRPSLEADAFGQFFNAFDELSEEERRALAAQCRDRLPNIVQLLHQRLVGAADHRERAVRVALCMDLARDLAEDLYVLARDADPVVRASAVAALGQVPASMTARILRDALHDPHARVQANAVEAIDRLGLTEVSASLHDKLQSGDQRVRANAVAALLKRNLPEAAQSLLQMLDHAMPAHRISALWVVERLSLIALQQRIERMSVSDPDERVRRRAARALRAAIMDGAATRAPSIAGASNQPARRRMD
mgnify:FL=1